MKKFFYLLLSLQQLQAKKTFGSDFDIGVGLYSSAKVEDFFPEDNLVLGNIILELGFKQERYCEKNVFPKYEDKIVQIFSMIIPNKLVNNDVQYCGFAIEGKLGFKFPHYSFISDYVCINAHWSYKMKKSSKEGNNKKFYDKNWLPDLEIYFEKKMKKLNIIAGINFALSKNFFKDYSFLTGIRFSKHFFIIIDVTHLDKTVSAITKIASCMSFLTLFASMLGFDLMFEGKKYKIATSNMKFKDVCVEQNLLTSLKEIVDYMKDNEKYIKIGAELPRGMLIYGPPGTGKTLVAKALSGEIENCSFTSVSAADFMCPYYGIKRLEEMFREARSKSAAVIFIDELEILGDRATPVANALLTLLDGFDKIKDNVFVLGATNNLNKIDPAILRSGRFDRRFYLGLPNEKQRLEILKIHTKNRILDEDINLEEIAKLTNEFSGADLSTLINESAFNAITKRDATSISMQDFLVCIKKIRNKISIRLLNQKEKDREIDFENRKKIADYVEKIRNKK